MPGRSGLKNLAFPDPDIIPGKKNGTNERQQKQNVEKKSSRSSRKDKVFMVQSESVLFSGGREIQYPPLL